MKNPKPSIVSSYYLMAISEHKEIPSSLLKYSSVK